MATNKKRSRWEPAHDKFIIARYKKGEPIEYIAEDVTAKFKIPRSVSTTQGRLGLLKRKGVLEPRARGKAEVSLSEPHVKAAATKKAAGQTGGRPKKKAATNGRNGRNGHSNGHTRTFMIDHGELGKLTVTAEGPIILDTEFMEGLTGLTARLLNA